MVAARNVPLANLQILVKGLHPVGLDARRALAGRGTLQRRAGMQRVFLRLCVSESNRTRMGNGALAGTAAVKWRPRDGGSVAATSGMEGQAPYIG
jgi:hypothetical protein